MPVYHLSGLMAVTDAGLGREYHVPSFGVVIETPAPVVPTGGFVRIVGSEVGGFRLAGPGGLAG